MTHPSRPNRRPVEFQTASLDTPVIARTFGPGDDLSQPGPDWTAARTLYLRLASPDLGVVIEPLSVEGCGPFRGRVLGFEPPEAEPGGIALGDEVEFREEQIFGADLGSI